MSPTDKLIRIHGLTEHAIKNQLPEATLLKIKNLINEEHVAGTFVTEVTRFSRLAVRWLSRDRFHRLGSSRSHPRAVRLHSGFHRNAQLRTPWNYRPSSL